MESGLALVVAFDEVQELIECSAVCGLGSRSGSLAGHGRLNRNEGKADSVFTIAYDFGHDDDRAVGARSVAAGSLQGHHYQSAKQPSLGGREVEPGVANVLDGVRYGPAAIPKIGDERGRFIAVPSPLITQ